MKLRMRASFLLPGALSLMMLDGCGAAGTNQSGLSAYNNLNPNVLPPGVSVPSQAAVIPNAQADAGWQTCIGTCANAAIPLTYVLTQNVPLPSLNNDGNASSYTESGTPFGDVMWYKQFGNSAATHFVIDLYVRIDNPQNVEALEFAVLQHDGLNWYKTSTQCNYQSGLLRGFNVQSFQWVSLGANCVRAQANTWQRVTLQYSTAGGTTNFEGVSFDGVLQPIAVSLPPEVLTASSQTMGIHVQLDNADTTAGYTLYVDDWSVYSW